MMNRVVTVIGDIASGKSTLSKRLVDIFHANYVAADELFLINPFFQAAVTDRNRWSLTSDLWFLKERVKLLKAIDMTTHPLTVVDSGLLMGLAYTAMRESVGQYTAAEWQLYQDYYHELTESCPKSDIVVYLSVDSQLTMERIRLRGREHEVKNYTKEYVEGLHWGLEYVKAELEKKQIPVIKKTITTTEALDESLLQAVLAELKHYD